MFNDINFANPEFFYFLIIIPILIAWYIWKGLKRYSALTVSTIEPFNTIKPSLKIRLRHILFVLRIIALISLIIVLARPQSSSKNRNVTSEGIDIVLAIDVSTSMLAKDFKPDRLEAAKKTAMDFINNRIDDRIGLVIFAGESFTQCPVTSDHDVIKNMMESIKTGLLEDGTAIGMGLATAISRLKNSKSKSRVIILLTDGVNNRGNIDPLTAAEIAKTFGIRVYTIGVGTQGKALYPFKLQDGRTVNDYVEVEIDEPILKNISKNTDAKYFRATNNKALDDIYKEIDKLEKTRIEVTEWTRRSEEFMFYAIIAALSIIAEIVLRMTVFRKIP